MGDAIRSPAAGTFPVRGHVSFLDGGYRWWMGTGSQVTGSELLATVRVSQFPPVAIENRSGSVTGKRGYGKSEITAIADGGPTLW